MTSCAHRVWFESLILKISLPDIIISGCLSIKSKCTIPKEVIHDLSKLNFSGEGEPSFHAHVLLFMTFFKCHRIKSRDLLAALLTLTFEGHVKKWCRILPFHSIDSFG